MGSGFLQCVLGTSMGREPKLESEAYLFICSEFDSERRDKVFIFGFSRGAFAARSLADFID